MYVYYCNIPSLLLLYNINIIVFIAIQHDPCVFTSENIDTELILAIYIDDGLVAVSQKLIDKLLEELKTEFDITSSEPNTYFGLQIKHLTDGSIFVHQETYCRKILAQFRMEKTNTIANPTDPYHQMCSEMHENRDKDRNLSSSEEECAIL